MKKLALTTTLLMVLLSLIAPSQRAFSAKPRIFSTGSPQEIQVAKELAVRHLETLLPEYGIEKIEDVHVSRVDIDERSKAHIRVEQAFRGIPVWDTEVIVHLNPDGTMASLTEGFAKNINVDPNPKLTKKQAVKRAIREFGRGADSLTSDPEAELCILRRDYPVILSPSTAQPWDRDYLVWRVRLQRVDFNEEIACPVYFIDAHTGKIVWQYEDVESAASSLSLGAAQTPFNQFGILTSGRSVYRGFISSATPPPEPMFAYEVQFLVNGLLIPTYYLEDVHRNIGTFDTNLKVFTNTNNIWADPVATQNIQLAAVDAHYGAEKTYDYFRFVHGRNGIDGRFGPRFLVPTYGSTGLVGGIVHFNGLISDTAFNRSNAAWISDGYFVCGDGDSTIGPLVAIDIVAHELTHGVTQYSATLGHTNEQGALNESISDVFGAMVQYFVTGGSSNNPDIWSFGEQCFTFKGRHDALRYMNDPRIKGDPDHYSNLNRNGNEVHHNAGIPNKVFYLLSQGGTNPTSGGTVNAIGPSDAARIWYLALIAYIKRDTNFAAARVATLNAARDLYGMPGGRPSRQYQAVAQAWMVCGVY